MAFGPCMREHVTVGVAVTFQCVETQIDSRRNHQIVVAEPGIGIDGDNPFHGIDSHRAPVDQDHAFAVELGVIELLRANRTQIRQNGVGQRIGGEYRIGFDQRHDRTGVRLFDRARAICGPDP
jgi:hypothetical protein